MNYLMIWRCALCNWTTPPDLESDHARWSALNKHDLAAHPRRRP